MEVRRFDDILVATNVYSYVLFYFFIYSTEIGTTILYLKSQNNASRTMTSYMLNSLLMQTKNFMEAKTIDQLRAWKMAQMRHEVIEAYQAVAQT